MARATVTDADLSYTTNFDDPRARGDLFQSILIAQLVDELTTDPVRTQPRVSSSVDGVLPKYARDGVAGLVGVPTRVFPRLDAQQYPVDVSFAVEGYVPLAVEPTPNLVAQPTFPAVFDGLDLGALSLRRQPIAVTARTVQLNSQNRPVALPLAVASITGIWRAAKDVLSTAPPAAADLVAFAPGLYASRPQPATTIDAVTLTPAGDPLRRLLFDIAPGTNRIVVDRGGGLAPGSIVGIDRNDNDRVEHIEVATVIAPTDPESPAIFELRFAVQHRHAASAPVERVTPSAPSLLTNITDPGRPGDATLFVNAVGPFGPNPIVVRISGGTAAAEYGVCSRYRVTTDGAGYGTFAPLSRVAAIEVTGVAGVLTSPPNRFTPNYSVFENRIDLTLA
jgi:hypothetical protein